MKALEAADAELSPMALVATTEHVYVLALVNVVTVSGDVAPDAVCVAPPSLEVQVAVKAVTVSPPSLPAVNATIAELLPSVTPETVGADGFVAATKALDAVDAALSPVEFVATTAQVYVLALVNVVTVNGEVAPDADRVVPPSLEVHVAVNPVIALPPLPLAVKATIPELLPRVRLTNVGACGTVPATKELDAEEATLLPSALVATIVQVYVLACVSEPTVIGDEVPLADCVVPPSLEVQVTVKPVTVSPPSLPAVKATIPESLPRVTPEMVGAEGDPRRRTTSRRSTTGCRRPRWLPPRRRCTSWRWSAKRP